MIPKHKFLDAIFLIGGSVYDFHDRFRIESLDSLSTEEDILRVMKHRILLQGEEFGELCRACNKVLIDNMYEEAVDTLYIALGTILSLSDFGIDACKKVCEKNDGKTRDDYSFSSSGKIVRK